MNRRLRKKLHRGEYVVFGFDLEFITKERLEWNGPNGEFDGPGIVFSESLDEWAHRHGWCCAPGGDGKRWSVFVMPDKINILYPGIIEKEREEIINHVKSLSEVDKVVVGLLVDAYGDWTKTAEKEWKEFCHKADEEFGVFKKDFT